MSTGPRLTLSYAESLALGLLQRWSPYCHQISVAGSVRRREPRVGDLEIVAWPRESTLWTDGLTNELTRMVAHGELEHGAKQGPRYQQWTLPRHGRVRLDLFLAGELNYGLILALRTGPQGFSNRLVTPWSEKGRLQDGYRVDGGRLVCIQTGDVVPVPDEREFLTKWCGGWVDPQRRR